MNAVIKQEFTVFTKNWTNITRYGTLLIEPAKLFNDFLHSEFEVVHDYRYLNITVIRGLKNDLKKLKTFQAYDKVVQIDHPIAHFAKILKGLNALQNQYLYQAYEWWIHREQGVTLPNEAFEGGIFPPADYPVSDKSKHLVRAVRQYECPPAWMPVLNVSMGPKNVYNTHVDYALKGLMETRLVAVSAGNNGPSKGSTSTMNRFVRNEPHDGLIVVGATDDTGTKLAHYSSTGLRHERYRRPCVVANPGKSLGTSFAAPKVANLACICFDAMIQVANVECSLRSIIAAGVPLMGWGAIDVLEGSLALPGRNNLPAMPFIGVREKELRDAFSLLHKKGLKIKLPIHGPPIRQLLMSSAKPLAGYEHHEIGEGLVSEELLLDYLSELRFGPMLHSFFEGVPASQVPPTVWDLKVFDRDELQELAAIGTCARPIWVYDYEAPQFVVNRIVNEHLVELPIHGHGVRVAAAGAGII